jgi:hypothetical protein
VNIATRQNLRSYSLAARETKSRGAKPDKLMRDALVVALNREAEGADGKPTKKLALIADAIVDKAASGDVAAATFVADRVDGKAHQTAELTIDDKRDATDWTRAELVAFLDNAANGRGGASEADGRSERPDPVH